MGGEHEEWIVRAVGVGESDRDALLTQTPAIQEGKACLRDNIGSSQKAVGDGAGFRTALVT